MKRMSKLSDGDDTGKLTIYTEENFTGQSKTFTENDANVPKNGWKNEIKSIVVQGNPWICYPELSYKVRL